jgi:membrane dipeptidase
MGTLAEAKKLHKSSWVVDTHCDTIIRILDKGVDISKRSTDGGDIDIPKLRKAKVDVQFFALWVAPEYIESGTSVHRCLRLIDALKSTVARHHRHLAWATDLSSIRAARRAGKVACVPAIEGGHAIDDDLAVLRMYYELGVRYMTLTWMNNNNWADGSGDTPEHNGLTKFGKQVIREMNSLGMIVDVSHVSEKTFWDVMKVTKAPVMVSHSNARALCDHHRNLTDKQLRAVGKNGGVVCVNYYPGFLYRDEHTPDETKAKSYASLIAATKKAPPITVDVLVDHIVHIATVAGPEHVGLGSDYDGVPTTVQGLEDIGKLPKLTKGLLDAGMSRKQVSGVLGGNVIKYLGRIWG